MFGFRYCTLLASVCFFFDCIGFILLGFQFHPSFAAPSEDNGSNKEAIKNLENCLDNLKIPIGAPCDVRKLKKADANLMVSLDVLKELASQQCIAHSSCQDANCTCNSASTCDKTQNKSATCAIEYHYFVQKSSSAFSSGSSSGGAVVVVEKKNSNYYDKINEWKRQKELAVRNRYHHANPHIGLKPLNAFAETEIEKEKRVRLQQAAQVELDICLYNFNIPYFEQCLVNKPEEFLRHRDDVADSNGGVCPLEFQIQVAAATCQQSPRRSKCGSNGKCGCVGDCPAKHLRSSKNCKAEYNEVEAHNKGTPKLRKFRRVMDACIVNFNKPYGADCNEEEIVAARKKYNKLIKKRGGFEKLTLAEIKAYNGQLCYGLSVCETFKSNKCFCDEFIFPECGNPAKKPDPNKTCQIELEEFDGIILSFKAGISVMNSIGISLLQQLENRHFHAGLALLTAAIYFVYLA